MQGRNRDADAEKDHMDMVVQKGWGELRDWN